MLCQNATYLSIDNLRRHLNGAHARLRLNEGKATQVATLGEIGLYGSVPVRVSNQHVKKLAIFVSYFKYVKGFPSRGFSITTAFGEELATKQAPMQLMAVGAD
jgi:hypothetical protein